MEWIPVLVLVVLVLLIIIRNIHVVQQSRAYVIERLGAFSKVWQVGIHFKVPFIERVAKKVSLKEQEFEHYYGRPATKKRKLYNGRLQCNVYMYY